MYQTTEAFQTAVKSNQRIWDARITIDTANEHLELTDADIVQGTLSVKEGALQTDLLCPGGVSKADLEVQLFNPSGRFDQVQFNNATLKVETGLELPDGSVEYVPLGLFTIDSSDRKTAGVIKLTGWDNLTKFDRPFSDVGQTFPCTGLELLTAMCRVCGVALAQTDFPNATLMLPTAPDGTPTCREVLLALMQIACSFAQCDRETGALTIRWFQNPGYVTETDIDGSTDDVDGGDFTNWDNLDRDGGVFKPADPDLTIGPGERYDLTYEDNPIEISGVQFTGQNAAGAQQTLLQGSTRYAIDLSGNLLLSLSTDAGVALATTVVHSLADRLIGFKYLPFSSCWIGNPAVQPGDFIEQVDRNGVHRRTIVTSLTDVYRGVSLISAQGESENTKDYAVNAIGKLASLAAAASGAKAIANAATQLIAGALGGYVVQGSGKYAGSLFVADNPDITKAQNVWRWSAGGFGHSSTGPDGPFTTAITAGGSIWAKLITADMIKAGRLESQDGTSWLDLTTGAFSLANGAMTWDKDNGFNCVSASKIQVPGSSEYISIGNFSVNNTSYDGLAFYNPDENRAISIFGNQSNSGFIINDGFYIVFKDGMSYGLELSPGNYAMFGNSAFPYTTIGGQTVQILGDNSVLISQGGQKGWSGTYKTQSGQTVTVMNGIIISCL